MLEQQASSQWTETPCSRELCGRVYQYRSVHEGSPEWVEFSQLGSFALTHDGLLLVVDNEFPRWMRESQVHSYDARSADHQFLGSQSSLPSRVHGIAHRPHTSPIFSTRYRTG